MYIEQDLINYLINDDCKSLLNIWPKELCKPRFN